MEETECPARSHISSDPHTGTAPTLPSAPRSIEPSATSTVPTAAQALPLHHTQSEATSRRVRALADVIKQLGPSRALFLTPRYVRVHGSQEISCCWTNLASERERKGSNPNLILLEHQFLHFTRELRTMLCELRRLLRNRDKAVAKSGLNPGAGGRAQEQADCGGATQG